MEFIVNAISLITTIFTKFFTMCKSFFQIIIDVFNGIYSILSTLWFGLKTLTSGVWSLLVDLFNGSLFNYLFDGFNQLAGYIGFKGALFMSSLLFVVFVRICISWIFKMFRLNQDYKTMKTKWK